MPYHLFQYALPGPADLGDLNGCLGRERVVEVRQHLVPTGGGATLVFVVQTAFAGTPPPSPGQSGGGGKKRIDYRAELSPEDFAVFVRLRDERKRLAEAEGVPLYTILTNEQLADLARRRPATLAALAETAGLGPARLDKHGPRLLEALREAASAGNPTVSTP